MVSRRRFVTSTASVLLAATGCGRRSDNAAFPVDPATDHFIDPRDFGVRGDGRSDDTQAIQSALDAAPGVPVRVPNGVYLIDTASPLNPPSGTRLVLADHAVLQALPRNAAFFGVVRIQYVSDVQITGGVVRGDLEEHTAHPSCPEKGFGLWIRDAEGVAVRGVTVERCWTDGVYVGADARDVSVLNCVIRTCRRQGISITSARRVRVRDCTITDIAGAAPSSGIDVEPNLGTAVDDVTISGSTFARNAGYGILLAGHRAPLENVLVEGNLTRDNGLGGVSVITARAVRVVGNTLEESAVPVLRVTADVQDIRIERNLYPGGGTVLLGDPPLPRPDPRPPSEGCF